MSDEDVAHSAQRLVQFSDGVFTVALTLLVIDIAVPNLPAGTSPDVLTRQLWDQLPNIAAFALSFWVVGAYWLTHHRHYVFIRRYDGTLLLLNLLLLMTVCFIPWPTAVIGHFGNYFVAWVLYALSMAAMGFATAAVWFYASSRPALVDGVTPELRRFYMARAVVTPAVFLISIPIAAINLAVGEYSWILIFVALRYLSHRYRAQVDARHRAII
jgi:uncharacterized membrane protein